MSTPLHVALLGAFHFPVPQGSQVYVAEQARALVRAGARVTLLCYGGRAVEARRWPFAVAQTPPHSAPASHRAGPQLRKPLADAALGKLLEDQHRRDPFDVVLAHNVEAALVALRARRRLGLPVVYVAHTLLGEELGVYGPRLLRRPANALGAVLDRHSARRSDAAIALSRRAQQTLSGLREGGVALIPPGLDPQEPPSKREIETACRAHGLEPGGFALYAGNLDAYQDIQDLEAAARRTPEIPMVVATHDTTLRTTYLRVVSTHDAALVRQLTFGAGTALCPRRVCAGFPIKLLNYMEAGRAILAREGVGGTLRHDDDAWLLPGGADGEDFVRALRALQRDARLRGRLGGAARKTLAREHAWSTLAQQTLQVVEDARRRASL